MNNGRLSRASSDLAVRTSPYIGTVGAFAHRLWVGLDTDFGSLTLVFSGTQTVSGLQIRTPEGDWKHVKSIPGGITVNVRLTLPYSDCTTIRVF